MPANRRRSAITAPYERWVLLGKLLETRRRVLGHTWRTTFEAASGVNKRLAADIEKAAKDRVDHFMPGTLELIAHGYEVTHESVLAVLRGERDDLVPAAPAAPAVPGEPPGWTPPIGGAAYSADVRHRTDRIWERLRQLALRGVADPDGTQVFLRAAGDPRGYAGIGSPADARDWDGAGSRLDLPDRVWLIADLQRGDAARAAGSGTGAAGALPRGNVAGRGA